VKKLLVFVSTSIFIFSTAVAVVGAPEASNEELLKEIQALKVRILELETRLDRQEQKIKQTQTSTKEIQDKVEQVDANISRKQEGFPAVIAEGLKINAGATMVIQGTDEINADDVSRQEAMTDASYSADLKIEKAFEDYGKAFLHLESGKGQGLEDELKVFSNVNQDAKDNEDVRVTEIWYEHYLKVLPLVLTFGKLKPTSYFDGNAFAHNETTQFLGRMFKSSPTIEFPDNTVGVRLAFSPLDSLEFDLGSFDADADWEDILDETFSIGQINIKPNLLNRKGNYRLLAWLSDREHTKWAGSTNKKEKAYGFGLSFDQELTDSLGVFVRYGWQDPEQRLNGLTDDFSLVYSWSAGLELKGSLWSRKDDVFALAVGEAIPSDDYKNAGTNLDAKSEGHFETYYRYKVNEHLSISPDIQLIWNPYGRDAATDDATINVYGMRAQVDF